MWTKRLHRFHDTGLSFWTFGMRVNRAFGHDQLISLNEYIEAFQKGYYYRADQPIAYYSSQRGGRQ